MIGEPPLSLGGSQSKVTDVSVKSSNLTGPLGIPGAAGGRVMTRITNSSISLIHISSGHFFQVKVIDLNIQAGVNWQQVQNFHKECILLEITVLSCLDNKSKIVSWHWIIYDCTFIKNFIYEHYIFMQISYVI